MKKILVSILMITFSIINAQQIFEFEKEIEDKENYIHQEVQFENPNEKIKLYGTLIIPKTEFDKILIIVPGSGIDSQNSHYLLTQELLRNNIAVFRYDERGVGKSEGDNTFLRYGISQITDDLLSAISAIKNEKILDNKTLGLLGHSQGGMATIGAYQKQGEIDFLIQWAAPVQKHGEFFKYQIKTGVNKFDSELKYDNIDKKIEIIGVAQKVIEENLTDDDISLSKKINKETKKHGHKRKNYDRFQFWTFPSMKDILKQNYESTYRDSKIPILYIIGSRDIFVDPNANTELLRSFENPQIDIKTMEGLNHYLTSELIEPTTRLIMKNSFYEMDREALKEIIDWINKK